MWDNGIDWILMDEVIDDEAIEIIEKEGRLRDFIRALRELAKREPQVKSVLEQYNLL